MNTKVPVQEIEFNFFYMHYRDAKKMHELSNAEESKLKSLYVRHSIISSVFACEALINRIYDDFYLPDSGKKIIEKTNLFDKWFCAPIVCGINKPPGMLFEINEEPFQSFKELIKIRNWLLHPKPGLYFPAFASGYILVDEDKNEVIPWVDVLKGERWPQTQIPVNPFELSSSDSAKILEIVDELITKLLSVFEEVIDEKWLNSIGFIDKRMKEKQTLTIDSLWGGYTPDEE